MLEYINKIKALLDEAKNELSTDEYNGVLEEIQAEVDDRLM